MRVCVSAVAGVPPTGVTDTVSLPSRPANSETSRVYVPSAGTVKLARRESRVLPIPSSLNPIWAPVPSRTRSTGSGNVPPPPVWPTASIW